MRRKEGAGRASSDQQVRAEGNRQRRQKNGIKRKKQDGAVARLLTGAKGGERDHVGGEQRRTRPSRGYCLLIRKLHSRLRMLLEISLILPIAVELSHPSSVLQDGTVLFEDQRTTQEMLRIPNRNVWKSVDAMRYRHRDTARTRRMSEQIF